MLKGGALAGVLALAAGCGGGGTPERDSGAVSNEVATQSRAIMDMMQITGQLVGSSPPRGTPTDMSCDDDNDDSPERVMTQMWTLHAKDNTLLGKGMANLLAGLPKQGWKVVKNAPDSSMNRNQEILATHLATKTQIDVTWEKNIQYGDPLIQFDVFSRCFRTPSAT
ncbi:hypothetical protein NMG29_06300 [Streptomyces cocklensis]|nr:hypothetical protein [Actinacidiphila cocklensis]MDD1057841.1 hypothetical protein [Actinacidiphila cocklensis]WSX78677.1 hypothetical protein OH826_35430 [Streptomyces sp. NBC_00899]